MYNSLKGDDMPALCDMFKNRFESEIDWKASILLYNIEKSATIDVNSYSIISKYATGSYYKAKLTFKKWKRA